MSYWNELTLQNSGHATFDTYVKKLELHTKFRLI